MGQEPLQLLRQMVKDSALEQDGLARELGQRPPHMVDMGPDLPAVTRPPAYRPETQVLGGPEFAQHTEAILNAVPELRGRASRIQHGPTRSVGAFPTNILGVHHSPSREISINPLVDDPSVIGHELGHGAGMDEPTARILQRLMEMFRR